MMMSLEAFSSLKTASKDLCDSSEKKSSEGSDMAAMDEPIAIPCENKEVDPDATIRKVNSKVW